MIVLLRKLNRSIAFINMKCGKFSLIVPSFDLLKKGIVPGRMSIRQVDRH